MNFHFMDFDFCYAKHLLRNYTILLQLAIYLHIPNSSIGFVVFGG